ncbi:FAD/NAD(P)-binding protein [Tersicoccus sp. MR15.9]|uniref:FAD/NAD(P)-binding protein n=1 Tax=Tersicoccus mangrovi TaxID=3121635 RepID=UPI002FE50167
MGQPREVTVAVVGAGPRGTSVLERLLAHARVNPDVHVDLHLIDPFPPGPGRVWRADQSRLPLMNTPSLFPTVVPDGALEVPGVAGSTFDAWRERLTREGEDDRTGSGLDGREWGELCGLTSSDFPTRRLYGRYLAATLAELRAAAPGNVTVTEHRATVTGVTRRKAGAEPAAGARRFSLTLDDGDRNRTEEDGRTTVTLEADAVALAYGHQESRLRPDQQLLRDAAATHGLRYQPPAIPADVDLTDVRAGEPVLVRGLGLNFFDLMAELTEGRGGVFEPWQDGGRTRYTYRPSGREPVLHAASRRGVPYRAKAVLQTYVPRRVRLRFFTDDAARSLRREGATLTFRHDLWPLMRRDALWAYYATMAETTPSDLLGDGSRFLTELDALLTEPARGDDPAWDDRLGKLTAQYVHEHARINPDKLAQPLGRRSWESAEAFDADVLEYLHGDAAGSARGEDDPLKVAIGALNAGRYLLKTVVADGGITDESWLRELRGWFEPFVEGLASGPPVQRIEQLIALAEAGVVHFLGPDPQFGVEESGEAFVASSPWVARPPVTARVMLEATAPANAIARAESPLLTGMLADGLIRPRSMMGVTGTPEVTSGVDVTLPPYRAIDAAGRTVDGLYVIGLPLSSVQLGTAIAAEAHSSARSGGRTLWDADRIAADIIATAAATNA